MSGFRTTKSYTMHLQGTPEQIFPLFCPTREYEWIENWQCELVYSDSGVAELGCVFKTRFPSEGPEETWVVSRYEPPARIEFVRINPLRSVHFSIALTRNPDNTTQARWTQVFTGLSPEGNEFVRSLSDEEFKKKTAGREKMINHFLSTGQMLKSS